MHPDLWWLISPSAPPSSPAPLTSRRSPRPFWCPEQIQKFSLSCFLDQCQSPCLFILTQPPCPRNTPFGLRFPGYLQGYEVLLLKYNKWPKLLAMSARDVTGGSDCENQLPTMCLTQHSVFLTFIRIPSDACQRCRVLGHTAAYPTKGSKDKARNLPFQKAPHSL